MRLRDAVAVPPSTDVSKQTSPAPQPQAASTSLISPAQAITSAVSCTVAVSPTSMIANAGVVPESQIATCPALEPPFVAELKKSPAPSMSVISTFEIAPNPVFSTVMVQVTRSPTEVFCTEGVLLIRMAPGRISTDVELTFCSGTPGSAQSSKSTVIMSVPDTAAQVVLML